MSLLNSILFLGLNDYLPEEDRNSVIVTNGLNFIFASLTLPLIVLFLFIKPIISLLALLPFLLYLLGFWLVSRGRFLAARLLLPFAVLFSIFFIAGVVQDLEMYISGYKYLILVSVVIPFMIFKLKELHYTLVFLLVTFVLLIFSDKILHHLHTAYSVNIPKHQLLFVDKVVLSEAFLALTAVSFIYRKYVTLYFEKLRGNLKDLIEYKTRMEQKNRELRYQNHLIQKIMENANDAIILTESADNIIVWNKKAKEIFGYDTEEVLGENPHRLLALDQDYQRIDEKIRHFKKSGDCDLIGKTVETKARTKDGSIVDIELSLSAISVGNQTYSLAIIRDVTDKKRQNRLILQKNVQLERLTKDLTDSIEYARIIQNALFQRDESIRILSAYFRDYFIFFKPLQIVSGDFFYIRQTRKFVIVGVGDCTGHGIPGAFMTLITVSILNELIGPKITLMPNQVLEKLSFHLKRALGHGNNLRDTVELALLFFDKRKNKVYFAGANLPMYFVRNGKLEEIKPDKYPVADMYRNDQSFSLKTIELNPMDVIFLSTDGYYSQFGGPHNKKYSRKRFRQLLLSLAAMDFTDASHRIEREFFHWKQANDQTDDVLVIGLKI